MIGALLGDGADVNAPDEEGETPLHRAAEHDNLPAVEALIERGADVGARDDKGRMPLHRAARRSNRPDVIEKLLNEGADASAMDDRDSTPCDYARDNEDLRGRAIVSRLCD